MDKKQIKELMKVQESRGMTTREARELFDALRDCHREFTKAENRIKSASKRFRRERP